MDEPKYRVIRSVVVGNAADGSLIRYLEGFFDSENLAYLPKTNVAEGSNFIASDSGDWYFFNEGNNEYNQLGTVGG